MAWQDQFPDGKISWRARCLIAAVLVPVTILFASMNWAWPALIAAFTTLGMIVGAAVDYFLGESDAANEKRFDE